MVRVTQMLEARLVGEGDWIGAAEICRLCRIEQSALVELSELGLVTGRQTFEGWQVAASALPRLRIAGRLMRDLGVNVSGAALAVELLEARHLLESRLRDLERLASGH
jgi:chaperone modulatory protein CbpM